MQGVGRDGKGSLLRTGERAAPGRPRWSRVSSPRAGPVCRGGTGRHWCHPAGDALTHPPAPGRGRGQRPAGEVPSSAPRCRGRPTGGGNPIKGRTQPPPPFSSFPPRPCPARVQAQPLRSAPAPAQLPARLPPRRDARRRPSPAATGPHLPGSGGGGGTRRTWRCSAAVTATASPGCCSWLRASDAPRRRGGASLAGKVGRAAVPGWEDALSAPRLHPAKFLVPL